VVAGSCAPLPPDGTVEAVVAADYLVATERLVDGDESLYENAFDTVPMSLNPPGPVAPAPRRAIPLTLVVAIAIVVAGISVGGTAVYFELRPAPSSGATVTDDLGRTVAVPSDPARVVVLGPDVMDTIYRLGLRSHVVGIDCSNETLGGLEGDYTPSQVALWSLTTSMCVVAYPEVSSADLLNANPQVVLASTVVAVAPLEEWSATYGVPVVFYGPSTLGSIVYDVQMTATIFGVGATASHLVLQLQTALGQSTAFLANLTNNGTPLRSVLMTYYPVPAGEPYAGYYTFGPGSFGQSMIELAGGVNIAGSAPSSDPELSGSQVLYDNPSAVIYGVGFGVNLTSYQQGPDWSMLPAVAQGNVTGIDVTLMTEADPTMVLYLPTFTQILYPAVPGG
jgi:iron complex transport system substrate-binding protein